MRRPDSEMSDMICAIASQKTSAKRRGCEFCYLDILPAAVSEPRAHRSAQIEQISETPTRESPSQEMASQKHCEQGRVMRGRSSEWLRPRSSSSSRASSGRATRPGTTRLGSARGVYRALKRGPTEEAGVALRRRNGGSIHPCGRKMVKIRPRLHFPPVFSRN